MKGHEFKNCQQVMSKHIYCLFAIIFSLQTVAAQDIRSIDGSGNNTSFVEWGSTNALLKRVSPADYVDGISIPKLDESFNRPNPRTISNTLFDQPDLINSDQNLSDYTWVFGQFIDHDLTLILDNRLEGLSNIVVPEEDFFFTPNSIIPMSRSLEANGTGTSIDNPRNYNNAVTSYLDGSMVYGSTEEVSNWLRTGQDGLLKTSSGDLLPWNTIDGEFNSQKIDHTAPEMDDATNSLKYLFVAGDARANENPLLLAFHTIFVREHNRIAGLIKQQNPFWSDDQVFEAARRKNIGFIQHITFDEWLPAMGVKLPEYNGYKNDVKVEIFNEFSAAAFRFGHTLINSNIIRMKNDGEEIERGNTTLKDAFFNPYLVVLSGGVDPFVKGMATQTQQELDCKVIDDVRNFLFESPGAPGLDLASININRGRERGLPDYNTVRVHFGLPTIPTFFELTESEEEARLLGETYGSISNLDPWVGMLAETHMEGSMMGRLMQVIMKDQFQLLRDGDRFYYENDPGLSATDKSEIKKTKLRDIIMRNTDIEIMQDEVFLAVSHEDIPNAPKPIPVDLDATLNPTLVSEMLNLNVFSNVEGMATFQIISMNGSVVKTETRSLSPGENAIYIPVEDNMTHGVYNLLIYTDEAYNIIKFIKD